MIFALMESSLESISLGIEPLSCCYQFRVAVRDGDGNPRGKD
jgi:hypothetical protein